MYGVPPVPKFETVGFSASHVCGTSIRYGEPSGKKLVARTT